MTLSRRLARIVLPIAIGAVWAPHVPVHGAQAQSARRSFGPGRCGPVDDVFTSLAAATGGHVLIVNPSEMDPDVVATAMTMPTDTPLLLSATGTAADPLSLPVDGSIRRLVITATFDATGGTLDVRAPDGAAVEASDAAERVQDARLACGRTLVIDRPDAGVWRAIPSPSGRFWLRVQAVSDFDLTDSEFVQSGGPLMHGGAFKIAGQPVPGRPAMLSVSVSAPAMKSYEFALLSEQGRALKTVTLAQANAGTWLGTVDVPPEPFRIVVSGVDQSGARYQRSSKVPFRPELVEVRPDSLAALVQPGAENRVAFTIRNAAPDRASYGIAAADDRGFVTRVEPALLDLDAGAEQQIAVWLKVPSGTVLESADILTVTASSIGQRPTSNSAAVAVGIRQ